MKLLQAILAVFVFVALVLAQQRHDRGAGDKQGKLPQTSTSRSPVINSFTASTDTVFIPCLPNAFTCTPAQPIVSISIDASDPDGDSLRYTYSATGGRVIGEGAVVNWDPTGAAIGSYSIKVEVSDGRGGVASKSIIVKVIECPNCDPPCVTITVSGQNDVDEGQSIIFTTNVSGGDPDLNPTYSWSISAGKIINGQGTPSIVVDTSGLGGHEVTATVEAGGFPPECHHKAASTTQVRKK